jgi:hypothetical protein
VKETGLLWKSLTAGQQQQVLEAFVDSEDDGNLISLEELKLKYS